jgi:hypothetical protein
MMVKILGLIRLFLELGAVALEMLKAAIAMYKRYKADLDKEQDYETQTA